jgi:hypothetical protein
MHIRYRFVVQAWIWRDNLRSSARGSFSMAPMHFLHQSQKKKSTNNRTNENFQKTHDVNQGSILQVIPSGAGGPSLSLGETWIASDSLTGVVVQVRFLFFFCFASVRGFLCVCVC